MILHKTKQTVSIPNRIIRYIIYAYIAVSGVIILMTN